MLIQKIAKLRFGLMNMTIKLYVDDVLKEECAEDGFIVSVRTKNMNIFNLFSDEKNLVLPCSEKSYLFPNGAVYALKISTSPVYSEVCNIMKDFKGLTFMEICDGNAKLQIDY